MTQEKTLIEPSAQLTAPTVMNIHHLSKSFGDNHVLQDFNLTLRKGESIVVLGKSGSGKSVLIKCIIGLLYSDEGRIEVYGKNMPDLNHEELDKIRAKIGFLFQSNALYDSMTVKENLEFPLRRQWIQLSQAEVKRSVIEALDDVGLSHTVNMMPAELSGGMRKRIALARTLIMKPEIILYDEPTTGLDPITAKEIIQLIVEIQDKYKSSSLIITHDMTCVRMASDRVVLLMDGRAYVEGTYEELRRSKDIKVKQFFE
jgi:phospholipid/cholesterol/gamma-HCH transport system ATP-binding protein